MLRATADTDYLVLEMSARHRGNIAALAAIARPSIAAVLNVGTAHLGEFGSREAIAETKSELVQALPASGVAILNADDPIVAAMAAKTAARVVLVGRSEGPTSAPRTSPSTNWPARVFPLRTADGAVRCSWPCTANTRWAMR